METIEVVQQIPLPAIEAPVVVSQPAVVQGVVHVALFGKEAALAQAQNLTQNFKPNTLGRTAIFRA